MRTFELLVTRAATGLALLAAPILAPGAAAQAAPASLVGDWRGTSICTAAGKPTCHDEVVVYHLRRDSSVAPAGVERLQWEANKIVNGREEGMATLPCEYRAAAGVATCPMRGWTWRFEARADSLTGTLANPAGIVWRNVRVARVTAGGAAHE